MTTQREIPVSYEDRDNFLNFGKVVIVKPSDTMLPAGYKKFANAIYNFEYRRDDVCLFTFPKSGTGRHIGEIERALTESLNNRVYFVDNDFMHRFKEDDYRLKLKNLCPDAKEDDGLVLQLAALEKGRRLIWSHLSFDLQNPDVLDKCKRLEKLQQFLKYVGSLYFSALKTFGNASLPLIAETFLSGKAIYGSYWHHANEAWKRRDHPNLHIMFYEDMKADIMAELRKLNEFLGTNLTEDQLKKVAEHTNFNNMKENPTMAPNSVDFKGSFFHTGKVGSSKGQLSPELDARVDAWVKENASKLDPAFKYAF
ncbi:luciferin sulfotransferase-like [Macrobrachium nipponense]|uniref:luciferin sulfotransferase-like n=1 Tax=Macrobrachium nipponense TaxID=159736 RepID=UPI0030C8660F